MATIASALQAVKLEIERMGKGPVALLAVSKTWPAESVREAYEAGQRAFGESYVQEALEKMQALSDLDIEWHFIGPVQSNKTKFIAEHFDWVHSVDRERIATRLSEARPEGLPPLQVCIQVNVSGETSKSGIEPEKAADLAKCISGLGKLKLRGLMAIPEPTMDRDLQRRRFAELRRLKESLVEYDLDTLSMGMSSDYASAIQEGATIVRIGSAIFGNRKRK
ncbi:MAG TPA: YggS family pyridoxal phosphate-dependent enzyme [Burkholderiales bacterium]|nr:YggS family pyridoxal phosphate-dependent enzyme [Burkholderiales bacterium]